MDRLWAPWRLDYIQGPETEGCVFCIDADNANDPERLVVTRGESCYVMMNRYPYSNGHLMVSPYRHLGDPAELEEPEVLDLHRMMVRSQVVLRDICCAEGFNVGWNFGHAAGAGIAGHIHMHIVPRWAGDTNFMTILAETRVIPQHLEETYALLVDAFSG
jgi:ATP adenylyltransferase